MTTKLLLIALAVSLFSCADQPVPETPRHGWGQWYAPYNTPMHEVTDI